MRILNDSGYEFVPEVTDNRWQMVDSMGIELETAELLYSFVRAIKPDIVTETGTFPGVGTEALRRGLVDNEWGHLYTYEIREDLRQAMGLKYNTDSRCTVVSGSPPDYRAVQLTFMDSEPNSRRDEFKKWMETADPGAVLAIHDAKVLDVGPEVRDYQPKILVPVPRGLWLCTKE